MMATGSVIAVLGAGSWGTALALVLARNGRDTLLWGHSPGFMDALRADGENSRYLPGAGFPEKLEVTADLGRLAVKADRFFIVVPSHAFEDILDQLAAQRAAAGIGSARWIAWGTKGLSPATGCLLSDAVAAKFDSTPGVVVSGPSFAREVANRLPTALTAASLDSGAANEVADALRSSVMRVYTNTDIAGVQLGGAIKNIMAIATGISDGLGLGANARAALMTRGLAELRRLVATMGGRSDTVMGLTGVGDMILTCTDDQSRNRRVGKGLGSGRKLAEILDELGQEAEGVATTRILYHLQKPLDVEMPITEHVYRVLFEGMAPQKAVASLLAREAGSE